MSDIGIKNIDTPLKNKNAQLANLYLFLGIIYIVFVIAIISITMIIIAPYADQLARNPNEYLILVDPLYNITKTISLVSVVVYVLFIFVFLKIREFKYLFREMEKLFDYSLIVLVTYSVISIIDSLLAYVIVTKDLIRTALQEGYRVGYTSMPVNTPLSMISSILMIIGYALMGYALYKASNNYYELSSIRTGSVLLLIGAIIGIIPPLSGLGLLLIIISFFLLYSEFKAIYFENRDQEKTESIGLLST